MSRRSTVRKYKGNFLLWLSVFVFTILYSVLAHYLPPDVILFPEYDPSTDMDEKCKRMKPVDVDAVARKVKSAISGADAGSSTAARAQSTPVDDRSALVSPPSSPESPAFDLEVPSGTADHQFEAVYKGVPLSALPPGLVIRGNLFISICLFLFYMMVSIFLFTFLRGSTYVKTNFCYCYFFLWTLSQD